MSRARIEAFSDGVIAVAITLLALDLVVPGPGHGPLLGQLGDRWPSFVAYLISFFTIGIVWVNHHERMRDIALVNRTLLFLNLVLLLFVVLIPFATRTMAEYLTTGGQDAHISMALYGAVLEGMGLGFGLLFEWSLGEGHLKHPVPSAMRRTLRIRLTGGSAVYLMAIVVAFVNAPLSLAIIGAVALYYIVEPTPKALRGDRIG